MLKMPVVYRAYQGDGEMSKNEMIAMLLPAVREADLECLPIK